MSDVLGSAIYARLAADATLVALLDTYRTKPAIFADLDVPKDYVLDKGYVTAGQQITNEPFDTKTSTGNAPARDLGCYTRRTRGTHQVYAIADRVRTLVHRYRLEIVGYRTLIAAAAGPIAAETDATLYGLIVPVRWTLVRT